METTPDTHSPYPTASQGAPGTSPYGTANPEMDLAWQFVTRTDVSVFLTGKAGTGKTTFLRQLRQAMPKRMVVLAPTGVAAINAQGQTIHSFFQLPFGPFVPDSTRRVSKPEYRMAQSKKDLIKTLDLLVIDEMSMVRADLLDQIDDALRQYRDRTRLFGGVQLLLIGDLMQLAPVAKSDEWEMLSRYYDTPYFFSSRALRQVPYVTVELRHIYRQQDSAFIDILAAVRTGRMTDQVIRSLNERYIPGFRPDGRDWIRLTTHNHAANQYNEMRLAAIPTAASTYQARIEKDFPELSYPTDRTLTLKVGAQVMFVKNDLTDAHAYYNGKIGTVTRLAHDSIVVECPGDTAPIKVTPVVWENTKYTLDADTKEIREHVVGTFAQYPLRLAWAITVHKSQGLTFDHAVLDINQSFTHGQVYVALSRCRTLQGLVLSSPLQPYSVITDSTVDDYISQQSTAMASSVQRLPELKLQYTLRLIDELYSFAPLRRAHQWLTRVVDEHLRSQAPWLLRMLRETDERLEADIIRVAVAFRPQYLAAVQQCGGQIAGTPLAERIRRSAAYFRDKLRQIYAELLRTLALNIENKQTAKIYANAVSALRQSIEGKCQIFDILADEDFSTATYLNAKARATLSDAAPAPAPRRQKTTGRQKAPKPEKPSKLAKPKAPARERGSSARESKALYDSGLTPEQIAVKRGMAASTIYGHLMDYVATGDIDLDQLVTPEQQRLIMLTASKFDGAYTVSQLKELLPADISPGQIFITLRRHGRRDK